PRLPAPPDLPGLFPANALSAIGAMSAIAAAGRSVPGDISIVGFDDVRLSRHPSPPLTRVGQPAGKIARHATELLLGMIGGRKPRKLHHPFAPELIVRGSASSPS